MKAIWFNDYDYHTDKLYRRPGCPECREPFGKDSDGKYRCFSCGEEVTVEDDGMKKWLAEREETKVEWQDDPVLHSKNGHTSGCGGKNCVEVHYVRNHVTMKWQVGWGICHNCGSRFIV